MTHLDISKNIFLREFYCQQNQLTGLGTSKNLELSIFYCYKNKLTELDVSKNTNLSDFNCAYNQLKSLNLNNENNENLGDFDARENPYLFCITVYSEDTMNYYFSKWIDNHTFFSEIDCSYTYVPNKKFESFLENHGMGNGILNDHYVSTANIENITFLDVSDQSINNLKGIENFKSLETLDCSFNNLKKLNVFNNLFLKTLNCSSNQLKRLNISKNTALTHLNCSSNQLTKLSVYKNIGLVSIHCYFNKLTVLNLSKNIFLTEIYCYQNQLIKLNIKNNNNVNLKGFNASYNLDLKCVKVDSKSYMKNHWSSLIDENANYRKGCKEKLNHIKDLKFSLEDGKIVVNQPNIYIKIFNMLGHQIYNQNLSGVYYASFTNSKGMVRLERFYIFNQKIFVVN